MSRLPTNDRFMQCRNYPTKIGIYQVYVLWSGEHVLGSPFRVDIVVTMEKLCSWFAEQLEFTVRQNNLNDGYSVRPGPTTLVPAARSAVSSSSATTNKLRP